MLLSPLHAIFTIPCNTMAPSAIRQHFLQHEMKDKPYDKVNDNCQEWVLTFLNKISGILVKKIAKTNSKDSRWETSYFPNGSEKSFYRRHRVKLQYHVDEICSVPLLPVFLRTRITCVCCCACHWYSLHWSHPSLISLNHQSQNVSLFSFLSFSL